MSENSGAPEPDAVWDWEDPLLETLRWFVQLIDERAGITAADALQQAVRHWTCTMADRFNASYCWPDPVPRRGSVPSAESSTPT